jgi:hypothetical protein
MKNHSLILSALILAVSVSSYAKITKSEMLVNGDKSVFLYSHNDINSIDFKFQSKVMTLQFQDNKNIKTFIESSSERSKSDFSLSAEAATSALAESGPNMTVVLASEKECNGVKTSLQSWGFKVTQSEELLTAVAKNKSLVTKKDVFIAIFSHLFGDVLISHYVDQGALPKVFKNRVSDNPFIRVALTCSVDLAGQYLYKKYKLSKSEKTKVKKA